VLVELPAYGSFSGPGSSATASFHSEYLVQRLQPRHVGDAALAPLIAR
jgi:hypothetical protein